MKLNTQVTTQLNIGMRLVPAAIHRGIYHKLQKTLRMMRTAIEYVGWNTTSFNVNWEVFSASDFMLLSVQLLCSYITIRKEGAIRSIR